VINAVIYVRPENYGANAARCLDYCAERRYNVVGLVPGDWQAATRMLADGTAGVIVVAATDRREPLLPGVETVPRRRARRPASTNSPARRWSTPQPSGSPATLHR
jgi:hypothetical protein